MLGPGQLTRALTQVLDGPAISVTDLAIGRPGIGPDPSLGFEFRFSRDGRTHGWSSTAGEAESYTVLEVRLDITPIRLAEPLYRPATPR
jgi:cyanophycinase